MHKIVRSAAALAAALSLAAVLAAPAGADGPVCTIQGYLQHPLDCPLPGPGH